MTVLALIGKAGGSMGFSAIYVYSGEIYPTEVRTVGMGTSSMCARISGMAAPYIGGPLVGYDMMISGQAMLLSLLFDSVYQLLYLKIQ